MPLVPANTPMGRLEILEVYDFYDGPKLFACLNATDQRFLALWCDQDAESDSWLYLGLSPRRWEAVRSGAYDLRSAFLNPEEGFLYSVRNSRADDTANFSILTPAAIDRELLPVEGERLTPGEAPLSTVAVMDVHRAAEQQAREVVNLRLNFPTIYRSEAPTKQLGEILRNFQELLYAFGRSMYGDRAAPDVINATGTAVLATFAGSFGVQIGSTKFADLFGESLAGQSIDKLGDLLAIGADPERLREQLSELRARSASKYRAFLKSVADAETGMLMEWASPRRREVRRVEISREVASAAIRVVDDLKVEVAETFEVRSVLVAANLRTKYYELWDPERHQKYSGRILEDAMPQVEHATLSETYVATLREIVETAPATGEERIKWELAGLRPPGEERAPLEGGPA